MHIGVGGGGGGGGGWCACMRVKEGSGKTITKSPFKISVPCKVARHVHEVVHAAL